jgi:hypothetical protein
MKNINNINVRNSEIPKSLNCSLKELLNLEKRKIEPAEISVAIKKKIVITFIIAEK